MHPVKKTWWGRTVHAVAESDNSMGLHETYLSTLARYCHGDPTSIWLSEFPPGMAFTFKWWLPGLCVWHFIAPGKTYAILRQHQPHPSSSYGNPANNYQVKYLLTFGRYGDAASILLSKFPPGAAFARKRLPGLCIWRSISTPGETYGIQHRLMQTHVSCDDDPVVNLVLIRHFVQTPGKMWLQL
jgi:hypothetical protein